MNEPDWFESFFGADYFEIYRDVFPPEATAAEVEGIASLLGIPAGGRVLDLAWGHGRHAIPLAERGCRVTGYDLSENGTQVVRDYVWDLARNAIDERVTVVRSDGTRVEYATSVRTRSLHELLALAGLAGLEPVAWYGGLDGSPLQLDSRRLVLVSSRP